MGLVSCQGKNSFRTGLPMNIYTSWLLRLNNLYLFYSSKAPLSYKIGLGKNLFDNNQQMYRQLVMKLQSLNTSWLLLIYNLLHYSSSMD